MDTNNWRLTQGDGGGDPAMDFVDWRTQLQADFRQRIVNKIMETLKRHLPFSGQEGLLELKKIAVRFEEKIYTAATSQSDYLRKISLKMLTMETKSQNMMPNSMQSNLAGDEGPGWKSVPVHDPVVQDAANHALKTIQQRSNSLFPYELQEIIHANAEVVDLSAKFDLLLKLQRGDKEEKFKVEVHKKEDGVFHLNQMAEDHS